MPKAVNVYITSEMNSYGIHSSRWKEGEELVGMVSNKKSIETINGQRHFKQIFRQKIDISITLLNRGCFNSLPKKIFT